MHVLTVIDQPNPESFTHAAAARFNEGVAEAGHTFEIADLHAEGFDPRWTIADNAQFEDKPMPDDILREQARIEKCDALCMAFPLYWYGMPAMTKGWLDRVWSWGWAYDQVVDPDLSLLRSRTGIMLVPAGANPENWKPYDLEHAMDTIWRTSTMGVMGITDKRLHFLNGSDGSDNRRKGLLDKAHEIGLGIGAPQS